MLAIPFKKGSESVSNSVSSILEHTAEDKKYISDFDREIKIIIENQNENGI